MLSIDTLVIDVAERYALAEVAVRGEIKAGCVYRLATATSDVALHVRRPALNARHVAAMHAATHAAAGAGVPVAPPLRDRLGRSAFSVGKRLAEVTPWIDHDGFVKFADADGWMDACRVLAHLHDAIEPAPAAPDRADNAWIPTADLAQRLTTAAPLLREQADEGRRHELERVLDLSVQVLEVTADRLDPAGTPYQLTHGDYGGENVLMRDGRVAGVVDFCRLDVRPRLYDLAWIVFFAFLHEEVTDAHWAFARACCAAYASSTARPPDWDSLPHLFANIAAYGVGVAPDEETPVGEAVAFGRALPLAVAMLHDPSLMLDRIVPR